MTVRLSWTLHFTKCTFTFAFYWMLDSSRLRDLPASGLVVLLLVVPPQSKKATEFMSLFSPVWSARAFTGIASSPHSPKTWFANFKLAVCMTKCDSCLSLYAAPLMNWQLVQDLIGWDSTLESLSTGEAVIKKNNDKMNWVVQTYFGPIWQ